MSVILNRNLIPLRVYLYSYMLGICVPSVGNHFRKDCGYVAVEP